MESRIVIPRALFDELLRRDPIMVPIGETEDDVWVKIKNFLESKEGFDATINFILHSPDIVQE